MSICQRFLVSFVAVAAMGVMVLSGGNSAAAAPPERSTQVNAVGTVDGCVSTDDGDVCTSVSVQALNPSKLGGAALCLDVTTTDASGEDHFEEGCADASGSLEVDERGLWSASVGPIAVDLSVTVCE